jgi:hypothetical protein
MELLSSFGPLGRHKIISNGDGTVVVTKDTRIAMHARNVSIFAEIARSSRIAASKRRDDGFFTSEIVANSLLDTVSQLLRSIQPPQQHKWRVWYLSAAHAISNVAQAYKQEMYACLTNAGVWYVERDLNKRLRSICYTMTFPASNAASADVLDAILVAKTLRLSASPPLDLYFPLLFLL